MVNELIDLLSKSYSPFHVAKLICEKLQKNEFKRIEIKDKWELKKGKYYLQINDSLVIAFCINDINKGFNIVASHNDSPSFKLKPNPINTKNRTINTEPYGAGIYYSFFDKPLKIAGRVVFNGETIKSEIINGDKNVFIPSLPIHFKRESDTTINPIVMSPILPKEVNSLNDLIGVNKEILSFDLFLHNCEEPKIVDDCLIASKIDDLECAYTSLEAFINSSSKAINIYACFDNEEVGSLSQNGADSPILNEVLKSICLSLNKDYKEMLDNSIFVSADNAHAFNPNYPEKYDMDNCVYLNKGIVIKHNGNRRYVTDAISSALAKKYCSNANISFQEYANRSDIKGGSTLGAIANSHLGILSMDIGAAQLSMHSATEITGVDDINNLVCFFKEIYNSYIVKEHDEYRIRR